MFKTVFPVLALMVTACNATLEKVVLNPAIEPVTNSTSLNSFVSFTQLIEGQSSFILTITNSRCTCTAEFMPHYDRFLSERNLTGYTLEYTMVLYEPQKYELPVTDANSPILTIYESGALKYFKAYKTGDSKHNLTFTDYDALVTYLEARIDVS